MTKMIISFRIPSLLPWSPKRERRNARQNQHIFFSFSGSNWLSLYDLPPRNSLPATWTLFLLPTILQHQQQTDWRRLIIMTWRGAASGGGRAHFLLVHHPKAVVIVAAAPTLPLRRLRLALGHGTAAACCRCRAQEKEGRIPLPERNGWAAVAAQGFTVKEKMHFGLP
jgi:hypothetical protein